MKSKFHQYGYYKGQIIPEMIGRQDYYQFDLADTGGFLVINLENPTKEEIEQISKGGGEFTITCFPDVLWLTYKFGSLEYADGPYNPHLSTQATDLSKTLWTSCSNITFFLVNSVNGEVLFAGNVECGPEFAAALRTGVMCLLPQEFDRMQYDYMCRQIMQYSSKDIVSRCVASFKYTADDVLSSEYNSETEQIEFY